MPTHRLRRTLLAVATALGLSLGAAAPALAVDPVTFNGTQIIDEAGVLGSDKGELEDDLEKLQSKTGDRLYVVYVDRFTNPDKAADWAQATATANGWVGGNTSLLAVATKQRQFYLLTGQGSNASSKAGQARTEISKTLSKDDWAGAAEGTIKAFGGSTSSSGGLGLMLPVLIVVIVGVGAFLFFRSRRKRGAVGGAQRSGLPGSQGRVPTAEEIAQLRAQAGPLLIKADDAIRTSEQEMNFAMAAYGDDSVKTFREDLEKAKGQLAESFKLQQQLDDDIPDTPQDQYAWLTQIIEHCNAVNDELNSHRAEFDDLRRLESSAPQIAAELSQKVAGLNQRLEAGRAGLAGLSADYADSAVRQVQDNVDQAQERVSFVESASRTAQEAAAAGRNSEAAVNARAAQQALGQAEDLITAVESTRSRLAEAGARLTDAVRAGAQDLAQAKAALANGNQPGLAAPTAALEAALNQVRTQLAAGRPDPFGLLAGVEQARSGLDAPLAAVRDEAERAARAAQALDSTIRSASAKIEGTEDYVKSRRGGVGAEARTRLAEARRLLDDALASAQHDPQRALASAQRAEQLADAAAREAEQDVNGFQFGGNGNRGGYGGGFGGMNGMGGVVLGGILGSILASGGSHHHSDGGGGLFGGGGDGGFGGFGGGGGDFGGGGFGGFDGGGGDF